jgi:hypothetical protein
LNSLIGSRWKLHLRPKNLASAHIKDEDVPPLPYGKSAVDILTDFIKYLYTVAKRHIEEHHMGLNWSPIEDSIEFIFSHPNGWEGLQQQKYRDAIEGAGLVARTPEGRARVHMITEGEASLHYCVSSLPEESANTEPQAIVIIDAGGGTIDLSMYSVTFNPISCKEVAPAECMRLTLTTVRPLTPPFPLKVAYRAQCSSLVARRICCKVGGPFFILSPK